MFRGQTDRSAAFQSLREGAWSNEEEMQELASELIKQGSKLPIGLLFEIFHNALGRLRSAKSKQQATIIAQVLNGIPFDLVTPYYSEFLTSFLHDKEGFLQQHLNPKFITRNPGLLIGYLRQKKDKLQKVAFKLLVTMGKGTIYRELEQSLRKESWEDKKIGLFALKETAGSRAIPTLISFMSQSSGKERFYALELLTDTDNIQVIQAMLSAGQRSRDPDFRTKVAWGLGQTNSPKAIRPLMELVDDENWKTRIQAIRSLGQIRDENVIKPLKDLLEHPDHRIRREAVTVAAKNADIRLLPTLVDKLRDVHTGIREQALETLATLGREGRIDKYKIVIALMQNENKYIRSRLKEILAIFQDDDLISQLVLSLADEDWWVRQRVANTLLTLTEGDFELTAPLVELLGHENEITRRFAVEVLERLKAPVSVEALIDVLNSDDDWWVRERAIEALGNIGDPRALKHLVAVLKDDVMRYTAVTAIGKFREPQTIKALVWVLKRGNKDVRIEAIKALQRIAVPDVVEPISEMLEDEDIRVRLEASTALNRLKAQFEAEESSFGKIDVADEKVVPLLDGLLLTAKREGATDLYLLAESKPYMRRFGEAQVVYPMHLSGAESKKLLYGIINDEQMETFEKEMELDFSYIIEKKGRFRVNMFITREGVSGVFRIIPDSVPTMEELKIPPVLRRIADMHQGLVLITGAACQGKSTSMAAILDVINKRRKVNMISVEEPIEYIHKNVQAQITQREIGVHTHSFSKSLKSALRQDPDVIAIGELRDLESISIAITAAETGHLVLGTLHSFSASKTVDRIIGVFPQGHQSQIRLQLSETIRAVISQQLVTTTEGGRTAAFEIMFANVGIRKLIRERKTEQVTSMMIAGTEEGMITMDQYLLNMVQEGRITEEEGIYRAHNRGDFERMLEMQKEQAKEELKNRLNTSGTKHKLTNSTGRIPIDALTKGK